MQAMTKFMEQRDHFIVREISWFFNAINDGGFGKITGQIGNRCLQIASQIFSAARIIHPCATTLAGSRIQVQIKLANQSTFLFNPEEFHIRMPDRAVVG